jgi:hypothetical protein
MMHVTRALGIAALAGSLGLPASTVEAAQPVTFQTVPPRDRQPLPQSGTGVVKGKVVDGTTGAPIARARVRLSLNGPPRDPILTDASGRFSVSGLPPGTFTLSVEKTAYMAARYPEPGRTLRSMMRNPRLEAGQVIDDVTVPMYRGAVITGRVLDQHGDPVEFSEVRVLRAARSPGARMQARNMTRTNDIGEFRVPRLEAGSYFLLAVPQRRGPEASDIEPVPTYYPGVTSLEAALPIVIERGQVADATDIVLTEGATSLVTGTVVAASGEPVTWGGYINARAVGAMGTDGWGAGGGPLGRDGAFRLKLPPGEYEVEANVQPPPADPGTMLSGGAVSGVVNGLGASRTELSGSSRVSVSGADVSAIRIVIGQQGSISGRFIFDGTKPAPTNPQQMRINLSSNDGTPCRHSGSETRADWTFTITGVRGTCTPNVATGPAAPGWMVKSITYKGQDWMAKPMSIAAGQHVRGVEVVLTDKTTALVLEVNDERGVRTREYVALVYSTDEERWTTMGSRYVRTYMPRPIDTRSAPPTPRPGAPPGFQRVPPDTLPGLPPGEYFAVAVEDVEAEDSRDPAFLARLSKSATRIVISEGAPVHVTLRRQPAVTSEGR